MNSDTWGVFHDGDICQIEGNLPGDLKIHINIPYLRNMFPSEGEEFIIQLNKCTNFEFDEYDEKPTNILKTIETKKPEILYIDSLNPIVINCATGILRMEYNEAHVSLDTGESINDLQLEEASDKYWDEWKKNS